MKLVFISGPSGSGKTSLSNQILDKIKNGTVLSTDNYYKTGLISKLLSKYIEGYFDKRISFNYKLFKKDFNFILKNQTSINRRSYDFEKKTIQNFSYKKKYIKFLIVEGIFAKDFARTLYNQDYCTVELKINKKECLNRAVIRDFKDRGKEKKRAEKDFLKSWDIYYKKLKNLKKTENTTEFFITKNTNIDQILKKIFN